MSVAALRVLSSAAAKDSAISTIARVPIFAPFANGIGTASILYVAYIMILQNKIKIYDSYLRYLNPDLNPTLYKLDLVTRSNWGSAKIIFHRHI